MGITESPEKSHRLHGNGFTSVVSVADSVRSVIQSI